MKVYFKIIWSAVLLLNLTGCKDWLDLQPEEELTESQLFSTGEGYRTVLNGLYQTMATADLYGRELTWGVVDCMGQYYVFQENNSNAELYREATALNYRHARVESVIEAFWKNGFNIIANANNLIQNIEAAPADLFNKGEMERKMIMGEALACRALMQFDLLRLFAPASINDDGGNYVPYVEQYPDIQANGIGVKLYMEKVIADLEKARELVMEFDTSALGESVSASGGARFMNELEFDMEGYVDEKVESFFKGRGYRLSYYSITALLARAYQYIENHEKAFELAKEVVEFKVKGDYYEYQLYKDNFDDYLFSSANNRKDLKVISNLVFAVYNEKAYDEFSLDYYYALQGAPNLMGWLPINRENLNLFVLNGQDESSVDYRNKYMIFLAAGAYPLSGKWYLSDDEETRDQNASIIPVIRATEMYYIMAEYYARQGIWGEAQRILSDVRTARGCTEQLNIHDWNSFERVLLNEAAREWIAEGQLFYLYKRLNAPVNWGRPGVQNRPFTRAEYLLPIPENQSL